MSASTTSSFTAADSVAIVTYHAIAAGPSELERWEPGARLYVFTLEEFRRHLDHLAAAGFTTLSMGELVAWHQRGAGLPPRPLVLSFDDGHRSNAELAAPALAERGQRAVFFVTAGRIGRRDCVSWEQLGGMLAAGMEVGSHTLTHPCPSSLGKAELEHELAESKRVLEEGLARRVDYVASPTGYDSRHFADRAHKVGYRAAVQGVIGRNYRTTGLFALRRFVLKRSHGFDTFRRLVDPASRAYVPLRMKQAARNAVRRVIGVRGYEAIRGFLLRQGSGEAED